MIKSITKRMSLRLLLVIFVFFIMLISMLLMGVFAFVLIQLGVFDPIRDISVAVGADGINSGIGAWGAFFPISLFSIVLGTLITMFVSNRLLKPLKTIIDATKKVAAGDFSVRLETDSVPEIEDLTNSFNMMVEELGSVETLSNDFVNNFSHEFKTPIVSIRGFAKLLGDKDLPEADREEYTEIIIQESERLAGFAANVLDLTKVESTSILKEISTFSLDEQIRQVAALMEPRWREKNISIVLELDSVMITSNEDVLRQVWVNLLDNAIKFTSSKGNISMTLKNLGSEMKFLIEDDGIGIDEQGLARLYDKFYQGDTSHSGGGHGLGLTLVKRIIDICGGRIIAESTPGKGSTFTVTLPI